jgi:uncharacterized protein (DUF1786 family)
MKILTVDIGTGTQDIFLYDSRLDLENGFKLVLPSPTMLIHHQIKAATKLRTPILLTGKLMGGGPSAWAAKDHARAGLPIYATPEAAQTLDDEPAKVERMGIQIISDDEALGLPSTVHRLELKDFDFPLIAETFARFGVQLADLAAVCVAVFDHGNAPPGLSDRQFRFDYLDQRIRATPATCPANYAGCPEGRRDDVSGGARENALSAFAFLAPEIPPIMTRLQAVSASVQGLDCPLIIMDTAPAAILGATFDPQVAARKRKMIVNVGNFHVIAFRLGQNGIEGVFEHHTGEIDRPKLEIYLRALADGSLKHSDIFNDMGHGALIYGEEPLKLGTDDWDIVVTGPQRSLFTNSQSTNLLTPYFASPFGDMMLSGNFGLLAAAADLLPALAEPIRASLQGAGGKGVAPWDT